jgi:putative ABC transport system ATP-binding protein
VAKMEENNLIEFQDISKAYDGRILFEGFNLTLRNNEVVGLTGESGSGKSTLLRIAIDLVTPESGTVMALGQEVSQWDPRELRKQLVLIPQEAQMFPGTVRENLLWGLKLWGETAEEQDLEQILKEVRLSTDKLEKVAFNLSGGEKQRVAIARGLLLRPKALLLDEPTSALDETSALAVEDTINDLIREHSMGVLMVTHNKAQAERFTSRVVDIGGGSIQ